MIYILLPVHNRKETTLKFVRCLTKQTVQSYHVVLLDDGSKDGTADAVEAVLKDKVTVFRGNGSWWWGGSLQVGYEWVAKQKLGPQDVVLINNDDTEFKENFLETGLELLASHPQSQICARHLEKGTEDLMDRGTRLDPETFLIVPAKNDSELTFLSTRGLFLWARDFLKSGGFVPNEFPHYFSDYEFTYRLKKKLGLRMITSDRLNVYGSKERTFEVSLKGLSPTKAWKMMLSNKFINNPMMWSRVVVSFYPRRVWARHLGRIWGSFMRRWLTTFPRIVFTPVLLIVFPTLGFLRGIVTALKFKRYQGEP